MFIAESGYGIELISTGVTSKNKTKIRLKEFSAPINFTSFCVFINFLTYCILQDKLSQVQSSQPDQLTPEALEALSPEQASSRKSQKMIHRKKELLKIVQARPPKKGKTILYPWHTVTEFLGARGAVELIASQSSQSAQVQVPESIYSIFPRSMRSVRW